MTLSKEQSQALDAIHKHDWLRPFFLGGYAGTGKTFLLKTLQYRVPKVLFLAPTGKACQVLSSKIPGADIRTIHSALYSAQEVTEQQLSSYRDQAASGDDWARRMYEYYTRPNALRVRFSLNPCKELFSHLVVVDESSMVGQKEYEHLVSITKRIVFVGDPAQLPPVESPSILPPKFDAFLTTVHRAALESPITRLAMQIRTGQFRGWGPWASEGITVSKKLPRREYLAADQVLAGTNKIRCMLNKALRDEKISWFPQVGDKMIVKENVRRNNVLYLVNGDIGMVTEAEKISSAISLDVEYKPQPRLSVTLNSELVAPLYDAKPTVLPKFLSPVKLDYAYCITVHASQGSEWPNLVVYDDQMWASRPLDRQRLMYTAVTRAKEKLTIVTGA